MKLNDFIIEYTLRQGRTPSYAIVEDLTRRGCFEDTPPSALNNDIGSGSHIILNNNISISKNLTLPAGFIVAVNKFLHIKDEGDFYSISFACRYVRTFTNDLNEIDTQTTTKQFSGIKFYSQDFKLVDLPCSTLFAKECYGKGVKADGSPTKTTEYSFQL